MKKIGKSAFSKCVSLNAIRIHAVIPPQCGGDNTFKDVPVGVCRLTVPQGCKIAYNNAKVWKSFYQVVEAGFTKR